MKDDKIHQLVTIYEKAKNLCRDNRLIALGMVTALEASEPKNADSDDKKQAG